MTTQQIDKFDTTIVTMTDDYEHAPGEEFRLPLIALGGVFITVALMGLGASSTGTDGYDWSSAAVAGSAAVGLLLLGVTWFIGYRNRHIVARNWARYDTQTQALRSLLAQRVGFVLPAGFGHRYADPFIAATQQTAVFTHDGRTITVGTRRPYGQFPTYTVEIDTV